MGAIEIRYYKDANADGSEDWKFLAQQLAAAYRRAFYKKDEKGTWITGPDKDCAAAVEAITRASNYGNSA